MAFVVKDRIKETTTTTGTGTYTLAGAANGGYETFANIGNANKTYYACTDGTNWEVGLGTYTASGTTLSRDEIIESSNSNNAVSWGSGSKDIFVTLPSSKALVMDNNDDFNIASGDAIMFGAGTSFANMSLSINGSTGALGLSEPSFGTSVLNLTAQQLKGIGDGGDLHFLGQTTGGASRFRLYGGNTNVLTTNGDGSGVSINGALTASGDLTVDTNTLHVDATNNRVGIGTTSASFPLSVQADTNAQGLLILGRSSDDISEIAFRENDNSTALGELQYRQDHAIFRHRVGDLRFATGGTSERMRIDSSGRVLLGHTSSIPVEGNEQKLQLVGSDANDGITIARFNNNYGPYLSFGRSGSGTIGSYTAVPVDDELGRIQWGVADGTDMASIGASISAFTEELAASNDVPSRLVFSTTANNASTPTERMRIDSSGNVGIGDTSPYTWSSVQPSLNLRGTSASFPNRSGALIFKSQSGTHMTVMDFETSNDLRWYQSSNSGSSWSERMRLDSSGNLLVGLSSAEAVGTNAGTQLRADGLVYAAATSDAHILSRRSSDGAILNFRKDTTTVGSIGSYGSGSGMYLGAGDTGIAFNSTDDNVFPRNPSTNLPRDNAIDLGSSTARFKDLYLSGNITGPSQVTRDTNTSSLALAGGTNSNVGSNILLYGGSHASLAGVTRFRNGSSETMRIDSSGDVIIGDTTVHGGGVGASNKYLQVHGPSGAAGVLNLGRDTNTDNQSLGEVRFYNANNADDNNNDADGKMVAVVQARAETSDSNAGDDSGAHLIFSTKPEAGSLAERMRITSAGRVGVGVTDPDAGIELQTSLGDLNSVHIANTSSTGYGAKFIGGGNTVLRYIADFRDYNNQSRLRVDGSGNLNIVSSGSSLIDLRFTDSSVTAYAKIVGGKSGSGVGDLRFSTYSGGLSEAMRIDSSGNLLVGKTSTSISTSGVELRSTGEIVAVRNNNVFDINRTGTDGSIMQFRKDGTTVGSILATSGDLGIGTGDIGVRFSDSTDSIYPITSTTGFSRDAAVDIGYSTVRFKDLYLSGGVYLGGTGSANKLEDYEEGTHNITLNQGGVGVNSLYQTWRYTKIGRMVYIEGLFLATSGGDTNVVKINLPFTYLSRSGNTADQIIQTVGSYNVPTGSGGLKGSIVNNTSLLRFHKSVDNGAWTSLVGTDMASGDHIYVNLAYPTT